MSPKASGYVIGVLLTGSAIALLSLLDASASQSDWLTFGVFVVLACLAQLITARPPARQSFQFTPVLVLAGILLLSPFLVVLLIIIPHIVEWGKERCTRSPRLRNWHLQPFNIATHIIAASAAHVAYHLVAGPTARSMDTLSVAGAILASVVYLVLNHTLDAVPALNSRRVPIRKSGILDVQIILVDWVLLLMGVTVAVLWEVNPLLLAPALAPVMMIYQALQVPQLKMEAATDPKTGLWNARHFGKLFASELERARRFNRPLAFLMADLDLLRNVNNTYGHLAGDAVLEGIGQIINTCLREYDIAGRFGGEEFAIALPETDLEQACGIAERIRQVVEMTEFPALPSASLIHVTMSFGVSWFPSDGGQPNELIHQADIAVYHAKLQGRNRVSRADEVPQSVKLRMHSGDNRLEAPYMPTYTPRPEELSFNSQAI